MPAAKKSARDRRPYHHGDLHAALIVAALKLIAQHGVQGFALSDAARLAGVSVAAPYRHFEDKEALLAAIATEGFTTFRNALAQPAQEPDACKRLVAMGMVYVGFARRQPSHFKVMWESGIAKEKYPALVAVVSEAYQILESAACSLQPGGSSEQQQALVRAAWSMVHGYASLVLAGIIEGEDAELGRTLHLLIDQFSAKLLQA